MTVRVALVNNMPDPAFEETERQFGDLLRAGPGREVVLERYVLPGIPRGDTVQVAISERYRDVRYLFRRPPDGLIVTGTEPKCADLADEAYWPALQELLWWARSEVPSAVLSCLAAHAALQCFDGLVRRRLPVKCSGVFAQQLDASDPLVAGVGPVALAHSRLNDVPVADLEANGYRVLSRSDEAGWTVAAAELGQCLFVLFQGHPEYQRLTLLREYRRDVRRYLSGQGAYPTVPLGYLRPDGAALLERFAQVATSGPASPALMERFPFEEAGRHIGCNWRRAAQALVGNWVEELGRRAGSWGGRAAMAGGADASAYTEKGA
jgi:homoserine O-succinyltransferase